MLGLALILWASSGILLNHRKAIRHLSLGRNYLPKAYQYQNWNNASVRSSLEIDSANYLIYGNIGIWKTDSALQKFTPWMQGFPKGTDAIRTMRVVKTHDGSFFAATQAGLFFKADTSEKWTKVPILLHDERIQDIALRSDSVFVIDRSHLYLFPKASDPSRFQKIQLMSAVGDDNKVSLFLTLWFLHSGEAFGKIGKLIVDFFALVVIFLALSGYVYFLFPHRIRHLRKKAQQFQGWAKVLRFSVKWHQKIGIWLGGFLLVTALTGIFLRPPLLIPIANTRVNKLPWSTLDHPNSWTDRLRNIVWNEDGQRWILGTNDGIFSVDRHFSEQPIPLKGIPPISVMGINVLEPIDQTTFLVGSFNGLFVWQPLNDYVLDYFTGEKPVAPANVSKPISNNMISGLVKIAEKRLIFDYNRGLINAQVEMPQMIKDQPFPLWNCALEVHTGRIVQDYIGPFYILVVPLMGLGMLLILISGLVRWLKRKKAKKTN